VSSTSHQLADRLVAQPCDTGRWLGFGCPRPGSGLVIVSQCDLRWSVAKVGGTPKVVIPSESFCDGPTPVMASMPRSYRASGEVLCAKAIVPHSTRIANRIVRRIGGFSVIDIAISIGNRLSQCRVTKVPRDALTGRVKEVGISETAHVAARAAFYAVIVCWWVFASHSG